MRLRKADMCPALFSVFIFSIKVPLGHVLNVSLPVSRAVSEGFCFQIEVWKSQESFTYFKIFKPISWGERPAERRSRFIQRFPNF